MVFISNLAIAWWWQLITSGSKMQLNGYWHDSNELHVMVAWHMQCKLQNYIQWGHCTCPKWSQITCDGDMGLTLPAPELHVLRAWHMPMQAQELHIAEASHIVSWPLNVWHIGTIKLRLQCGVKPFKVALSNTTQYEVIVLGMIYIQQAQKLHLMMAVHMQYILQNCM